MANTALLPNRHCLNGWWDFLPRFEADPAPTVPQTGWLPGKYLVPSFWTKPRDGVRYTGETYFTDAHAASAYDAKDAEFLFDAFGYPSEWSKTRSAWVRRKLSLETVAPDRRYFLILDAVMPRARLFVNGRVACHHSQPTLPLEVDITPWLRAGENEIAVLIKDYSRDEHGRAQVPTGNAIPCDHSGIWQDVWLVERADVYLSDITIRTSTRTGTLSAIFEVANASQRSRQVRLLPEVVTWEKNRDPGDAPVELTLPAYELRLDAGEVATYEVSAPWPDAEWWYPERPKLYQIRTTISDLEPHTAPHLLTGDRDTRPASPQPGSPLETTYERFGFREVWIEGPAIMLNGYPLHLFSDWGHKWTPYYYTEGWIRQWFGMIRDANMNHSRLHTHPHPRIYLDLADEEGILITGETGLHGSGGAQAASSPAYWEAAHDHVRRFVRRDKNHPSIVLWSVENEMRWNTKREENRAEIEMIQEQLPTLRALFEELDPTRPAYHEGDSSLWNEKAQPIISRHYGKECAGIGWWDRTQPLHSGEMALYHYAGPNNTLHLGGDAVYASFVEIDRSAATDAAWIIEAGRTLGVSCFGPWNLSCLENLRASRKDMTLPYTEFNTPGVKPLRVPAHASEFEFWETGNGYTPNASFAIQARAFRPFAIIDRSLRSAYFAGRTFARELFVINDTPEPVDGVLTVTLCHTRNQIAVRRYSLSLGRGDITKVTFETTIPATAEQGDYVYTATFHAGSEGEGQALDTWERSIRIGCAGDDELAQEVRSVRIAAFGPGLLEAAFEDFGLAVAYVNELEPTTLQSVDILVMEKDTVVPGSQMNRLVQAFVQGGGRLILMEQSASLFPELRLEDKPVLKAFRRAYGHPALASITDSDLFAWGDAPYPLLASDAYVALRMYHKDDGRLMLPLVDSGEGGFGTGDLDFTPLFEAMDGAGLVLACQLRITDRWAEIPPARTLLANLLRRAAHFRAEQAPDPLVVCEDRTAGLDAALDAAREGQTVLVNNATPAALTAWSRALGVSLQIRDVGEVYQAVRVANDPLLNGVSNEDTCGIETFSYTPASAENARVASAVLEPTAGLEPLLQTATESCLRELMVYGGRTEALRAHTLSRFLGTEKPSPAIVLGRVRVGAGSVLFNQFAPPAATRARLERLGHRLLANLGHRFEGSLFAGDAVPHAPASGCGYPQVIDAYNGPADATLQREMLERCQPSMERMLATPILHLVPWQRLTSEDGTWGAAAFDLSQPLFLYHTIWSPTSRKNVETNLQVPNPEALTFLDLRGSGRAEVAVNGQAYGTVSLENGQATISDISLEMGGNHILIRWIPEASGDRLTLRWRNIMRQPEAALLFGSGGSSD